MVEMLALSVTLEVTEPPEMVFAAAGAKDSDGVAPLETSREKVELAASPLTGMVVV